MNSEEMLTTIKSKGYWRVVIRPTRFKADLIPNLSDVRQLVQSCVVSWRGWPYPYQRPDEARNVSDWVECSVDWQEFIEYWRFYRSGQFVHLFAVYEEHGNAGYLDFVSTIYTVTEIFEFAARLARKEVLQPSAFVSISLHNVAGHQLVSFGFNRLHSAEFVVKHDQPIVVGKEFSLQDLVSRTDELALDAIVEIFEQFNWNNPPRHIFAEDQKRLRERRL